MAHYCAHPALKSTPFLPGSVQLFRSGGDRFPVFHVTSFPSPSTLKDSSMEFICTICLARDANSLPQFDSMTNGIDCAMIGERNNPFKGNDSEGIFGTISSDHKYCV
ncbi:HpcH/HpaI aldolase [Anopheles sinensis]|uniref:HpcH/HpaI aldolase n=1 Tax=Anopheles sinensis TaxID=74873 RepID=A0A084WNP8_ANOSI|nr:HpcH/HpaI aldolase [Anopheles sinensis]